MSVVWEHVFDNFGIKQVTKTDKEKSAYVPNAQQRKAITAAGIKPASVRPGPEFSLTILFEPTGKTIRSSYYHSERKPSGRTPEPRMGHEIISSWLDKGDRVLIGNIGKQVFAIKLGTGVAVDKDVIAQEVVQRADPATILARAKAAKKGTPPTREVKRSDFARNPYVVAAALLRAKGSCEMPGCKRALFEKPDGTAYLEVHHVIPLGEDGDDMLGNVAALCPHCHREQHFGKDRVSQRKSLSKYVAKL
ncbi:MAG: HNH endonuclease [Proteobacteria bacterium]|nr:HNH endonuclease [Pseudomonadota bacterium]HQR03624.1 HNH endonuclease signature motif containing protein [Rhodocyclaceae bacterium]